MCPWPRMLIIQWEGLYGVRFKIKNRSLKILCSSSAHKTLFSFTSLLDIISVIGIYKILIIIFLLLNTNFFTALNFTAAVFNKIHKKTSLCTAPTNIPIIIVGMNKIYIKIQGTWFLKFTEHNIDVEPICSTWKLNNAGWSSLVARRAHNPKVVGSNPAPATNWFKWLLEIF